jgi:hypothetical protein
MKFKMKRITILIIYAISVTMSEAKANDMASESSAINDPGRKCDESNHTGIFHNIEVNNRTKNHTTSVPGYYVIRLSDSNEGAVRII